MGNKYHNQPVVVEGRRFDSQAEMRRWNELVLLERAGAIRELRFHPRFRLTEPFTTAGGERVGAITYEADFGYVEGERTVVEDTKGVWTEVFRIKRKLFLARYVGVELRVVGV